MNKGMIMAGLAGLVLVGAAGTIIILGGEVNETPEEDKFEHQVCPRAVASSGGRHVRVVGVSNAGANIEETALGRVVVGNLTKRSLCLVVFEEKEISGKPDLARELWVKRGMEPVKVPNSLLDDKWVWWSLFKGAGCGLIVNHSGYFGSTLKEFLTLPLATQERFLIREDGVVRFPNSLFGRPDLDFVEEIEGVLQDRFVIPAEIE